jgi:hypothetical protein
MMKPIAYDPFSRSPKTAQRVRVGYARGDFVRATTVIPSIDPKAPKVKRVTIGRGKKARTIKRVIIK